MHDQFLLSIVKNKSMEKRSHCSIVGLTGHCLAGQNVIICICFFFMFMSLPYANAENHKEQRAVASVNFGYLGITLIIVFGCFFLFFVAGCIGCFKSDGSISFHGGHAVISTVGNQGLEPTVIEGFPTFAYSYVKGHKLGKAILECAVCLTQFEDKDTIRLLPKCDHVFHPDCIDGWLLKHSTCPVCRANLVPAPCETSVTISEEPLEVALAVTVAPEMISQASMQNRPPRYAGSFPRSHSTGHSLFQQGENVDRFIVRLPHIVSMRQLSWSESMVATPRMTGAETGRLHETLLSDSSIVCTKAAESVASLTSFLV